MKTKLTPEQEIELVAAIKEAFHGDTSFDEASIYCRADAGNFPRLTAAIEAIVGLKARYPSKRRQGRLRPRPCKAAILAVRNHFETDEIGWWSVGTRRALRGPEPKILYSP
jgi:hypothetical protein